MFSEYSFSVLFLIFNIHQRFKIESVNRFFQVNAPALAEMGNPTLAPWMELAKKLSTFVISSSGAEAIHTLSACGDDISKAGKLLATAAALGMALGRELSQCNMISAQSVLKDSGTEVCLTIPFLFCVSIFFHPKNYCKVSLTNIRKHLDLLEF